jgi:hypothetical protein
MTTDTQSTTNEPFGGCSFCGPHQVIKGSSFGSSVPSRMEVGSNTSTVTLRVVGGDEKGNLESETVEYCDESHGPENDCAGEGQEQL